MRSRSSLTFSRSWALSLLTRTGGSTEQYCIFLLFMFLGTAWRLSQLFLTFQVMKLICKIKTQMWTSVTFGKKIFCELARWYESFEFQDEILSYLSCSYWCCQGRKSECMFSKHKYKAYSFNKWAWIIFKSHLDYIFYFEDYCFQLLSAWKRVCDVLLNCLRRAFVDLW